VQGEGNRHDEAALRDVVIRALAKQEMVSVDCRLAADTPIAAITHTLVCGKTTLRRYAAHN